MRAAPSGRVRRPPGLARPANGPTRRGPDRPGVGHRRGQRGVHRARGGAHGSAPIAGAPNPAGVHHPADLEQHRGPPAVGPAVRPRPRAAARPPVVGRARTGGGDRIGPGLQSELWQWKQWYVAEARHPPEANCAIISCRVAATHWLNGLGYCDWHRGLSLVNGLRHDCRACHLFNLLVLKPTGGDSRH